MPDLDQFSSAVPLLGQLPKYVADKQEQQRLASYDLYESIYWNVPATFKLLSRGQENSPIYIPSGRTIVETLHRFVANGVDFIPDPQFGTPNDQLLANQVMTDLKRRERLISKFNTNKRYGIMRGDWMFHLYADPEREAGAKISVFAIDPRKCFKITNPDNIDEVIGWHIIDVVTDDQNNQQIDRLTYMKESGTGGPSTIIMTRGLFKIEEWEDLEAKPEQILTADTPLPSPIDSLPVYHIPNFDEPNALWGSSEMRGLERIMEAINQGISDEELSLALDGLGVYATDSGTPVNDDGEEVPWNLGPARVVETPDGKKFYRVSGVTSVEPFQGHLSYLHGQMDQAAGISPIAKGNVDVQVAESGIALLLELGPLLAKAIEREQIVTDVTTNMLYDLSKWYVAYEGGTFRSLLEVTRWIPTYGPKVPKNAKQEFDELMTMLQSPTPVVSGTYVRQRLRLLGYNDMPDDLTMMAQILQEKQAVGQVAQDATGARIDSEVNNQLNSGDTGSGDNTGSGADGGSANS